MHLRVCLSRYVLILHRRQHVFRDLMAYSCTFEHCNSGLFESRIAWKSHELAEHRRDWQCPSCRRDFETKDSVVRHLSAEHPATEDGLVHALVTTASPQHISAKSSDCPFCDDYHASRDLLHRQPDDFQVSIDVHQRHLSRHMEQLALFAVPPTDDGDGDDSDDDDEASENDVISNVDEADDEDDEDDNDDDDDDVVEHSLQEAEDIIDSARQRDALEADHSPTTRNDYHMNLDPNASQRREHGSYRTRTTHHAPVDIVNVYNDIHQDGDSYSPPSATMPPYAPPQVPQYGPPSPGFRGRSGRLGDELAEELAELRMERQRRSRSRGHSEIPQYAPNPLGRTNDLETVERRSDGDIIVEVIEELSSVSGTPPPRRKSKRSISGYSSVSNFQPSPQPAPGEIAPPILNEYGYKTDLLDGVHDLEPDGAPRRSSSRLRNRLAPNSSGEPQDPTDSRNHALGLPERRNNFADSWPDSEPPDPSEDLRPTDQDLSGVHHVELDPREDQDLSGGVQFNLDSPGLPRQTEDIPPTDQDPSDLQRYGLVPLGQNNPEVAEPIEWYPNPTEKDARGPLSRDD